MKQKSKWNLSATIWRQFWRKEGGKSIVINIGPQFLTRLRVWLAKVGMYVLVNDIPWQTDMTWHTWWWIIDAAHLLRNHRWQVEISFFSLGVHVVFEKGSILGSFEKSEVELKEKEKCNCIYAFNRMTILSFLEIFFITHIHD